MPINVVKTTDDEKKWSKSKALAREEGQSGNYAYIMGIFKKMKGGSLKKKGEVLACSSLIRTKLGELLKKNDG